MAMIAAGDESALSLLVERHGARLRGLARGFTGSAADADEVVNWVFLGLWRAAPRWQAGRARISTWLHRATVNRCIDRARRRKVWGAVGAAMPEGAAEAMRDDAPGAETEIAMRQDLAAVGADIRRLPERQRAAILLAAGAGRSTAEIGEILEVSPGAAEQLLVRARRSLRESRRIRLAMEDRNG